MFAGYKKYIYIIH